LKGVIRIYNNLEETKWINNVQEGTREIHNVTKGTRMLSKEREGSRIFWHVPVAFKMFAIVLGRHRDIEGVC
jgi:hypothetical protein